jgi:hypothetical protein
LQSPCPSVRLSVRSYFRNRYLSFYWKKWFYIWYMALAWWLVPCLPFPGLPHTYFLFTVRLRIFHVCRNENFRNSYLSFYWKKWFYIWYMALAWWLVPCLPFPGLPHIYFLFTVRLTNERVGVFLARHSVQHLFLVFQSKYCEQERCFYLCFAQTGLNIFTVSSPYDEHRSSDPRPENLYFDQ